MNNPSKNFWQRNKAKLLIAIVTLFIFCASVFIFNIDAIVGNTLKGYANTQLFNGAITKANTNSNVITALGTLQPTNSLTILEGETAYTNNNTTMQSTITVNGTKGKAKMDILANFKNNSWHYQKIIIRIKQPSSKKQNITVLNIPTDTIYSNRKMYVYSIDSLIRTEDYKFAIYKKDSITFYKYINLSDENKNMLLTYNNNTNILNFSIDTFEKDTTAKNIKIDTTTFSLYYNRATYADANGPMYFNPKYGILSSFYYIMLPRNYKKEIADSIITNIYN